MIVNVLLLVFVGDDSVYQKTVGSKHGGLRIGKLRKGSNTFVNGVV